jgi:hypothetical protein
VVAQLFPGELFRDDKANDGATALLQGVGVVVFQHLPGQRFIALVAGDVVGEFVVKHVRQPLVKDEGQDEIFELRRVGSPANLAGGVPEPLFELGDIELGVGGARYLLGPLYLLQGDLKGTLRSFAWFAKTFPDDIGEPGQYLCWTLALYRSGSPEKAADKLLQTALRTLGPY